MFSRDPHDQTKGAKTQGKNTGLQLNQSIENLTGHFPAQKNLAAMKEQQQREKEILE